MAQKPNILDTLDSLVKKASEVKKAGLTSQEKTAAEKQVKVAEGVSAKLDSMNNGTKPATTGEQAASQITAEKEMYSAPSVDVGAKDSTPGASVTDNTAGSTAVSTSGSHGTEGSKLGPVTKEPLTSMGSDSKTAEVKKVAAELRKLAEASLTKLDRYLVKAASASTDPAIKAAAEAGDMGATSDAAADVLLQQLESGAISEEEAAAILQEAVQSGAIAEEELAGAGAEGAPADLGAVPVDAGAPPAGDVAAAAPLAAEAGADAAAAEAIADPGLEAKLAAAQLGPDHPEYPAKLAAAYPDVFAAGYQYAVKLAERLAKQAEEEVVVEEKKEDEKPAEANPGVPAAENAVDGQAAVPELAAGTPEEKAALEQVLQQLGIPPEALQQLVAAPMPAMDKVASLQHRYRTAIMAKVAALQAAPAPVAAKAK